MARESITATDSLNSHELNLAEAETMDGIVDQIASGLYNLASMLVGEGEQSIREQQAGAVRGGGRDAWSTQPRHTGRTGGAQTVRQLHR